MTTANVYDEILSDPIFTPALKEQILNVQDFQSETEAFVDKVVAGIHPNAILQGPPGLGKSYAVTRALNRSGKRPGDDYYVVKGHSDSTGLFILLYKYRRKGQVVVLDDCDDLYTKDIALEFLKGATDQDYRTVKWNSPRVPVINGSPITEFVFNGTLIVCSNMSMTTGTGSRRDRAASAFMSRLVKWDLQLNSRERMYAQIFNLVVNADYLSANPNTKLDADQKRDLLKFILENIDNIPNFDLRMPAKIAAEMNANPKTWTKAARHIVCA